MPTVTALIRYFQREREAFSREWTVDFWKFGAPEFNDRTFAAMVFEFVDCSNRDHVVVIVEELWGNLT